MVRRFGLVPPINVEGIARTLATVATKRIPFDIDGLCLDISEPGLRPKIWVADHVHHVRRRFTLAHEIGHIIIPWHSGSIIDELDVQSSRERTAYRQMEAEANRFAAELLMPNEWVRETAGRMSHVAGLVEHIQRIADVSLTAALIRAERYGQPGYLYVETRGDRIVRSGKTKGTKGAPPEVGTSFDAIETESFEDKRIIRSGEQTIVWWRIAQSVAVPPAPGEHWRDILTRILEMLPAADRKGAQQRVAAIVGNPIGKLPPGSPVEEIYARCLEVLTNRTDRDEQLRWITGHPEFKVYVLARAYERSQAKPK